MRSSAGILETAQPSASGGPLRERASRSLRLAAMGSLLFLHFPLLVIILYAFTTDKHTYQFPPPGLTLDWFGVILTRGDFWRALLLSVQVALTATGIALLLGSLTAGAIYRSKFFGRDTISLLVILPIALPGIVT